MVTSAVSRGDVAVTCVIISWPDVVIWSSNYRHVLSVVMSVRPLQRRLPWTHGAAAAAVGNYSRLFRWWHLSARCTDVKSASPATACEFTYLTIYSRVRFALSCSLSLSVCCSPTEDPLSFSRRHLSGDHCLEDKRQAELSELFRVVLHGYDSSLQFRSLHSSVFDIGSQRLWACWKRWGFNPRRNCPLEMEEMDRIVHSDTHTYMSSY